MTEPRCPRCGAELHGGIFIGSDMPVKQCSNRDCHELFAQNDAGEWVVPVDRPEGEFD
jgi:hypothetical protein